MAPQTLIGCFKAQTPDEELPQLFRLFGRLGAGEKTRYVGAITPNTFQLGKAKPDNYVT